MNLFHFIGRIVSWLFSLVTSALSHIAAWKYDRIGLPQNIRAKQLQLMETVAHGARVLEVGAGTGNTLSTGIYGGSPGRFSQLVLSEPDHGMRSRIKKKLYGRATGVAEGQISIIDAALPHLPFPDASFDVVIVFFVLSHVEDRGAAIRDIARVLAPNGKLVILDHGVMSHGRAHNHPHDHGPSHVLRHANDHHHKRAGDFSHHCHRSHALWVFEWMRFKRVHSHSHEGSQLDPLEKDLSLEMRFEKLLSNRMQVNYFFKEVMYGIFSRKTS